MRETRTSGSMSGDGKRSVAAWPKLPRPSSTLPTRKNSEHTNQFRLPRYCGGKIIAPSLSLHGSFDLDLAISAFVLLAVVTLWFSSRWIVGRDHSLQCNWMQRDMNEHEEIANALKARLSELRTHLAKVDRELHKPLSADSEDQAIELENQEALEVIEKTETTEIHQIEAALERISEGTYGTCAKCGEPIDPRRLKALPTAATCISCSA
jgi:DnaK suppressor protein